MKTEEATIRELIERTIELYRRYAVWWELVNKANFDQYNTIINNHEDFFSTVSHALFESFTVITYQLYERRKDTISIRSLIDELADTNPQLGQQLKSMVDQHQPLLAKAFAIRCGVYAHRNKARPPEEIFATAGLKPAEMETIVRMTVDIISSLAEAVGIDTKTEITEEMDRRGKYSHEDTHLIMKALEKNAL
jgi:hypothetical protein